MGGKTRAHRQVHRNARTLQPEPRLFRAAGMPPITSGRNARRYACLPLNPGRLCSANPLQRGRMYPSKVPPLSASPVAVFLRYWLPVLVWMALIFSASADRQSYQHSSLFFEPLMRCLFPTMPAATLEDIHHLFRKTCHLTEYAILGGLVWRAVRRPMKSNPRPWRWDEAGLALAVVFAYAASDEFHQIFVPNRTALVSDVLIDTSGGVTGLLLLWLWRKLLKPG